MENDLLGSIVVLTEYNSVRILYHNWEEIVTKDREDYLF